MDKDAAISRARAFLEKNNRPYAELIGAHHTERNGHAIWSVFFAKKLPPNVKAVLPSTIIVIVDDETGDTETFRSL